MNILRDAMAVDSLDPCGIYFGTTGGQVYASSDAGDNWTPIVRDLPAVLSVEAQTAAVIRVALPHHLRRSPASRGRFASTSRRRRARAVLDALEQSYPVLQGRSGTTRRPSGGTSSASSPAGRTSRASPWTTRCPRRRVGRGAVSRRRRDGRRLTGRRAVLKERVVRLDR